MEIDVFTQSGNSEGLATQGENLAENPAAVYLLSLSEGSRRAMVNALGTMAGLMTGTKPEGYAEQLAAALAYPWHNLRAEHTEVLRARLAEMYDPATANKMLSALKQVLKRAWRLGLMTEEERARASDLAPVKGGQSEPAGRAATPGELAALMEVCGNDQSPAGARDAAMIALLYTCGLRRAELAALTLADYDATAGILKIRHGKGNKTRVADVVNGAAVAMADWLSLRGTETPGPLFCAINKGGALNLSKRFTPQAVYNMIKKRCQQAGIEDLSPHDFRRTFVGDLLEAGADIATVQRMAGHANVETTARYDRRGAQARRKAAGLLHIPYHRRRLEPLPGSEGRP